MPDSPSPRRPDLERYRQMRDPTRTPEPFGKGVDPRPRGSGEGGLFVVQQHAARALHWDLRLEIEGVLASWAVPRGPSLDPRERRLAVHTEDHPIEYADFEGVIPEGNYGAGAMIVWDRGRYRTVDGSTPADGLEAGKLDLILEGHKLRGQFALVRTRRGSGRDWLLIHKAREAGIDLVVAQPASVLSGLTVEELRASGSRTEELAELADRAGAPRRELSPADLRPMLAERGEAPFSSEAHLFEPKLDGVRTLAVRRGDQIRLRSRRGRDVTGIYPEVTRGLARLPSREFVLDGEIASFDAHGRSSFELLQRRFTQTDARQVERLRVEIPVVFNAFDLLGVEGRDLRRLALRERKRILQRLVPRLGQVRFVDHVEEHGEALFELALTHGLEGVIAKRLDSVYESGARSRAWLKLKAPRIAELAIVGHQPGRGTRERLGSLLLAWWSGGELRYAGSVGSGLSEASIEELRAALDADVADVPPFTGGPQPTPKGVRYAQPRHAARVQYSEVTSAGLLRQPVFLGWQRDARIEECRAPDLRSGAEDVEVAVETPADEPSLPSDRELRITHRDKIFFPADGITKGDLLDYYTQIWPWMEPYLRDRPVVLTRYPDGIEGKSFFQKSAPDWTPAWVERAHLDDTDYFICNDLPTLLHVINSGSIPIHAWSARLESLERPDWLVIDLDPKGAPFAHVVELARHLHGMLRELDMPHYAKTSGQDGMHVLVPLGAALDHAQARTLAELLARVLCAERSDLATIARPLAARGNKVYVDHLQNGRGKLIVAPFSVRPRAGAPVSTPLRWAQVNARLDPRQLTVRNVARRMQRGGDPMREVLEARPPLGELLDALLSRLER